MVSASIAAAFFMGLTGGVHCLVMCALPCHAIIEQGVPTTKAPTPAPARPADAAAQVVHWQGAPWVHSTHRQHVVRCWRAAGFHAGRWLGYGLVGALVAWAMHGLVWLGQGAALLQPLWMAMHAAMLLWGLVMLVMARQPHWLEGIGLRAWRTLRPWVERRHGHFWLGLAWAGLPCGLLYSALMVAALSDSVWHGFFTMTAFGAGTSLWLLLGQGAWLGGAATVRRSAWPAWQRWGIRIAGLVLVAAASAALTMQAAGAPGAWWCR